MLESEPVLGLLVQIVQQSVIAANDDAPASTAQTATVSRPASR
jgi:hypothetical protein